MCLWLEASLFICKPRCSCRTFFIEGSFTNPTTSFVKELAPIQAEKAKFLFLILTALFITALVTTNLIANKFISVDLGFYTFVISAGVLPYPITFLITDILSEVYGRRRTNQVVVSGLFASLFVIVILKLGGFFPAIENSPVDNAGYDMVFQNTWRIIGASMIAYLAAQLVDVRLFHFWKKLTNGKHLWLRNNASTMFSQLVDTTLVIFVVFVGTPSSGDIGSMILDGWMYKLLIALFDTFLIYGAMAIIRSQLKIKMGEEVAI